MDACALLERLAAAGLTVSVTDAGLVRIQPVANLSDELRAAVVAMKAELLVLLKETPDAKAAPQAAPDRAPPPAPAPATTQERRQERNRRRRAQRLRIDYYPSDEAAKALATLRHKEAGSNTSSIINRLLAAAATPDATSYAPRKAA